MNKSGVGSNPITSSMKQTTFIVQMNDEGKILLLKRPYDHKKYPNQWTLPGGKVDPGETTEVCAYREMFEETGIRMLSFAKLPFFLGGETSVIYPYAALNQFEGEELDKAFPNREHVEYMWYDAEDNYPEGMSDLAIELLDQMEQLNLA